MPLGLRRPPVQRLPGVECRQFRGSQGCDRRDVPGPRGARRAAAHCPLHGGSQARTGLCDPTPRAAGLGRPSGRRAGGGDILLVHGAMVGVDVEADDWTQFHANPRPGLHYSAAELLAERGIAAVAADNNAVEAKSTVQGLSNPFHMVALRDMGCRWASSGSSRTWLPIAPRTASTSSCSWRSRYGSCTPPDRRSIRWPSSSPPERRGRRQELQQGVVCLRG